MFSTLKALHQTHRHTQFNREPREKEKTEFPFAYLACFAVCPAFLPQLLQSCFHSTRLPSVVASLQRWAEGCNRVAVGRAGSPLPAVYCNQRVQVGRDGTHELARYHSLQLSWTGKILSHPQNFTNVPGCQSHPMRLALRMRGIG